MNRLEEGGISLSAWGCQSRLTGVGAGVHGREGVGAGLHGGTVGVLASGTWEVLADELGRDKESASDLSMTGVGGGPLPECLADD